MYYLETHLYLLALAAGKPGSRVSSVAICTPSTQAVVSNCLSPLKQLKSLLKVWFQGWDIEMTRGVWNIFCQI